MPYALIHCNITVSAQSPHFILPVEVSTLLRFKMIKMLTRASQIKPNFDCSQIYQFSLPISKQFSCDDDVKKVKS